MDISVVFSTFKRVDILKRTLDSYVDIFCESICWEIIVVDNACDEKIKKIVESYKTLPIIYYQEKKKGKNFALNSVVGFLKGRLIVLSDDDIIADKFLLREILLGAQRWPDTAIFGGKILPHFPREVKDINLNDTMIKGAFVIADWDFPEGAHGYDANKVWGCCMVVRKQVFDKGWRFNTNIGPQGKNYIMGSETEFSRRLEASGMHPVYLPKAIVHHQIREEQLEHAWLLGRAYRAGRGSAVREQPKNVALLMKIPRFLLGDLMRIAYDYLLSTLKGDKKERLAIGMQYWYLRGKIYQYYVGIPTID